LGWGEAKAQLSALIEDELGPMRERYDALMARPERIEEILQAGALKARALATPLMERLREAVGLRAPSAAAAPAAASARPTGKKARFVSFRDEDGRFRFRLQAAGGREVLLSEPFDNPQA